MITLDGDNIEVVDRFSYLGDVISTEGGAQEAEHQELDRHGKNLKRFRMLYAEEAYHWNDRRSRRVFLCFYSTILQLTSAKFHTYADYSRTVWSSSMKF